MSTNGNGAYYAPLRQRMSESESDDDNNRLHGKPGKTEVCNLDINSGLQSSKNYSMSSMDEYNTNVNTIDSTMDNVSFLQSDLSNKMSASRRCAFIASIFCCILTVGVFLWGIPCSEKGSCSKPEWQDRTTSWELPYEDIELSGSVQVVDGAMPNSRNLIFIYRGNHMRQIDKQGNDNVNGVILIVGKSGKVGWYTRETRIPTQIDCHLLDVNRDGVKDCLVSGSEGLLAALSALSGTYYWYVHREGKVFSNVVSIDFPLVMRDIDRDKVNDLLTVATVLPSPHHNSLIIISGATGNIVGDPLPIKDCLSVKLITEFDPSNITYICKNGTVEAVRMISYPMLYSKMLKLDKTVNHSIPSQSTVVNLSLKKNIGNTREVYTNGDGKLIVENAGECPNSCKVNIKVYLTRNGTTNVSWEYTANHVYAMSPSSFAFANSIRGFVLKLLQWNSAHVAKGARKIDEVKYNIQNQSPKNPYDIFYRPSINVKSISSFIKYTNFTAHDISERIVLVSFDDIQTHYVNVSQVDLVQICARGPRDTHTAMPICQPDLEYQDKSLMIADLDGDKSHELISYYSTYVSPESTQKNSKAADYWRLSSVVRVIRLETELPKLFSSKK